MKKYEYKCVFVAGSAEKTSRILTEYGKQVKSTATQTSK